MALGGRIQSIRKNWKWSQLRLSRELLVDQASISLWESGKQMPSGIALYAMACLFRTSVHALTTGTGFAMPEPPIESKDNGGVMLIVDLESGKFRRKTFANIMGDAAIAFHEGRNVALILD